MKLVSAGKAVGCLVSHQVHRQLRERATASGLTVAQMVEALIRRGLGENAAGPDPDSHQVDADRADMRRMEIERDAARQDVADLKIAVKRAEADAAYWRETAERENDEVATLLSRLAEMKQAEVNAGRQITHWRERAEGLSAPSWPSPQAAGHRYMIDRGRDEAPATDADVLSPAFIKSCVGFRSVGNSPSAIAKLMKCDVSAVKRALEGKR